MILVVTDAMDDTANAVVACLNRSGARWARIHQAEYPERAQIVFDPSASGGGILMDQDGDPIDLGSITTTWIWHPMPFKLPPTLEGAQARFVAEACQCAFRLVLEFLGERSFMVNPPAREALANDKGLQLRTARKLGMAIPETIITNSPVQARQFCAAFPEVVFKLLNRPRLEYGDRASWISTNLLGLDDLDALDQLQHCPGIFQRRIPKRFDLRITVVGNQVFAGARAGALMAALGLGLLAQEGADSLVRKLVEEDQAVRTRQQPTGADGIVSQMLADKIRRCRAALAYLNDEIKEPETFAEVALLFQHGDQIDDRLVARELAILAAFHGFASSLPACAEDRMLLDLKRPQRFGTQFERGSPPRLDPGTIERGPWAATDALRLDFMAPLPSKARGLGPAEAGAACAAAIEVHQAIRRNPMAENLETLWALDPARSEVQAQLERLGRLPGTAWHRARIRRELRRLHRRGGLWLPADYAHASRLLLAAGTTPSQFLLANEWAAVAVMRGYAPAWSSFARSWDRAATSMGLPCRYGTKGGFMSPSVAPALRRALAVSNEKSGS